MSLDDFRGAAWSLRTLTERYDAYDALMKQDDPIDLPPRGRRYVYAGDDERMQRLKVDLPRCATAVQIEAWRESSEVVVRKSVLRADTRWRCA